MKHHLKRIAAPKTWPIARKDNKYITRPLGGSHPLRLGTSIETLLKHIIGITTKTRETKTLINNKEVFADEKLVKDIRLMVGFMDTVRLPKIKHSYRISLSDKEKIIAVKIDDKEAKLKLVKIIGKVAMKNKFQINASDGRNFLVENKEYKVGDTLLIEVPSQKIIEHLKLQKGSDIILTAGKHCGKIGVVEDITKDKFLFKINNDIYETSKSYAFVISDKVTIKDG